MSVRAKFTVQSITEFANAPNSAVNKQIKMSAVSRGKPDNEDWSRYTPQGTLDITITNPAAAEQFEAGKDYYLDFTPAD